MIKQLFLALTFLMPLSAHSHSVELLPFVGAGYTMAYMDTYPKERQHSDTYKEIGVNMEFRLGKHLAITWGMELLKTSFKVGEFPFEHYDPFTGITTTQPGYYVFTTRYFRVPFKVGYEYNISRKLSLSASGGPSLNYLIDNSREITTYHGPFSYTDQYNRFIVGISADVTVAYGFSESI